MRASKLIVGNWKMNGLLQDSDKRIDALLQKKKEAANLNVGVVLCPPATLLAHVTKSLKGRGWHCGGQDCHMENFGAFTGSISADMLRDAGCSYVILGHSERRQQFGETSLTVAAKAKAAHMSGLTAIICVGETNSERVSGQEYEVVSLQLFESIPDTATAENTVIAYEPVWAIGTGKVASAEDIVSMHKSIREKLTGKVKKVEDVFVLYGGSVKADNARDILSLQNVDGALVGGASLKAEDFWSIIDAGASITQKQEISGISS